MTAAAVMPPRRRIAPRTPARAATAPAPRRRSAAKPPVRMVRPSPLPLTVPSAEDAATAPVGGLESYLHRITCIALLPHEQQAALARRMRAGDEHARLALFEATLPFVVTIAGWYATSEDVRDELVQVGNLTMWRAMPTYDPDKLYRNKNTGKLAPITFPTFIARHLMGHMRRALPDLLSPVHRPVHIVDEEQHAYRIADAYFADHGTPMTDAELEAALAERRKKRKMPYTTPLSDIYAARRVAQVQSLDARRERESDAGKRGWDVSAAETGIRGGEVTDENSAPSAEDENQRGIVSEIVTRLCAEILTEREQHVISARFAHELTLDRTGQLLNITRERVRQIEAVALQKLRAANARGPHKGVLEQLAHEGV